MLLVGGGGDALHGLQNITIIVAAPFVVVMVGMCVALARTCATTRWCGAAELGAQLMEQAVIAGVAEHGHEDFNIVLQPSEEVDSTPAAERATVGAGASAGAERSPGQPRA